MWNSNFSYSIFSDQATSTRLLLFLPTMSAVVLLTRSKSDVVHDEAYSDPFFGRFDFVKWVENDTLKIGSFSLPRFFHFFVGYIGAVAKGFSTAFLVLFAVIFVFSPLIGGLAAIESRIAKKGFYGGLVTNAELPTGLADDCLEPMLLWQGERNAIFRCKQGYEIAISPEQFSDVSFRTEKRIR